MTLTSDERAELDRLRNLERTQRSADLVRRAAGDWTNPEDAVALLRVSGDLEYLEDAAEAQRAVKALASDRPYFLRGGQHEAVAATVTDSQGQTRLSREQLIKLSKPEIEALKVRDPGLYQRSMDALIAEARR
ncbi:MAG TPA: hypothetical protein VGG41_07035 [Solirubrobacteraceae bacterium]|jgi:hypothetical protein